MGDDPCDKERRPFQPGNSAKNELILYYLYQNNGKNVDTKHHTKGDKGCSC
jgi:hypothetical protein